ncbi:hypothetical protein [Brevibacterium sp.]|uniref:hypothetical protein n=1 Tax=Brevibacterium sp. TaxID=1701 RepID=UPI002810BCA2|nr:hypothetical protein [Brevibacterium sp.]
MIPGPIANHLDGFRGAFLLVLSIPWVFVGWSYLAVQTAARARAFAYLPDYLNENQLGWVWVIAALFIVACAALVRRHPRWTTLVGFDLFHPRLRAPDNEL